MARFFCFFHTVPLLGFLIIFANLAEMGSLYKSRSRVAPSTIFLLNLCIADFLIGLSMSITQILDHFYPNKGPFVNLFLSFVILRTAMVMSGINLMAITIDRLFATTKPFFYRKLRNKHAIIVCVCLWLPFTLIITILFILENTNDAWIDYKYINLFYPVVIFLTTAILIPSYCKIISILINQRRRVTPNPNQVAPPSYCIDIEATRRRRIMTKRRWSQRETGLIKLTIGIISAYVICSFPLSIYCFPRVFGSKDITHIGTTLFCMAALNALVDPLIYFHYIRRRISNFCRHLVSLFNSRFRNRGRFDTQATIASVNLSYTVEVTTRNELNTV